MIRIQSLLVLGIFTTSCRAECGPECRQNCLFVHNVYRKNHGAKPLVLEDELSRQAQKWADSGVIGTSEWARGPGGECWAYGDLFPSWFHVVKAWHDQEKAFNWTTYKSTDVRDVHCFRQVVWKLASRLGCGKSVVKGKPYYVAQMDKAGVVVDYLLGYQKFNVGKPKEPDLQWFLNATTYDTSAKAKPGKFSILEEPKEEPMPLNWKEQGLKPEQSRRASTTQRKRHI